MQIWCVRSKVCSFSNISSKFVAVREAARNTYVEKEGRKETKTLTGVNIFGCRKCLFVFESMVDISKAGSFS
jgi:hypothetical protein